MTTVRKALNSPQIDVDVTQEIIAASVQRDSSHCMLAEALRAAVPDAKYISVDLATIRFTDLAAGRRYIYLTPRRAQVELLKFDQGERSEPFKIKLRGAHVLPTGTGRRGKTTLEPSVDGNSVPARGGGLAPPLGPLPAGAPLRAREDARIKNPGAGAGNRTGKRREFGLRGIIR